MLQLGIVGLGGISQKAYLPYMRQVTGVHWHLFTRQKQILEEVNMLFGSSTAYDSLDSLAEPSILWMESSFMSRLVLTLI